MVVRNFTKTAAAEARKFNYTHFKNEKMKRQFEFIAEEGTSAMKDSEKLKRVSSKQGGK